MLEGKHKKRKGNMAGSLKWPLLLYNKNKGNRVEQEVKQAEESSPHNDSGKKPIGTEYHEALPLRALKKEERSEGDQEGPGLATPDKQA
jgi:hypothetical protein